MIKLLKKYEIQTKPFEATKTWAISNIKNDNLLLYESTGSDDGLPYALEFMDYGVTRPTENDNCDIALEQQDYDLATLELGLKIIGIFYPELDPINPDGTYKRSIYHQVKTMFYNDYLDPTKIWGVENIDFPLSRTERRLSDEIRLLDIPRNVFGDKIIPKSVTIVDNTTDNGYTITDDGNGNLFAGVNLFSHQQEVRNHENEFDHGSTAACDWYFSSGPPLTPINLTGSFLTKSVNIIYSVMTPTASLQWQPGPGGIPELGFVIQRQDAFVGPWNVVFTTGPGIYNGFDENDVTTFVPQQWYSYRVYAFNAFGNSSYSNVVDLYYDPYILVEITGSGANVHHSFGFGVLSPEKLPYSESAYVGLSLYSGSVFSTITLLTGSSDSASVISLAFYTGSLFDTIISSTGSGDSASLEYSFFSGTLFETVVTQSVNDDVSVVDTFFTGTLVLTTIVASNVAEEISNTTYAFYSGTLA